MTGPHEDVEMAARLIEQQGETDRAATSRTPPSGAEAAVLTTAEVLILVRMLRRVLTPDQRADVAAELAKQD